MSSVAAPTPARGTRPRNRRAITIDAATELFWRKGYAAVGMSDIAEATNVGASALYRHFPSKAELLIAAVEAGLAPFREVLDEADAHDAPPAEQLAVILARLSEVSLEQRALGVLWQREARNLTDDERRGLREELIQLTGRLSAALLAARPELDARGADLLAWCAMGALVSPSFHSADMPRAPFAALLLELVSTIAALPLPPTEETDAAAGPPEPAESRRDTIITVATRLFADRGFAATGIDDIGDAAGIAGPSVYSHFENKAAILVAAIERAHSVLRADADPVLEGDRPAPEKLARLIELYVQVANHDRSVIRTLLSELMNLPDEDRGEARRLQRDYIDSWVALYREFADVDLLSARIRVQAVLLIVNDAVQTPHLRARPGFEQTLSRMSKQLLGVPVSTVLA